MRLLHTSDWHLGRSFHRVGLLDAQARFVDHLVEVVRSEGIDAVVVAGDVYDRALPGVEAVALLDDALDRLLDAGAAVLVTSGNHDSAQRLGFGARRAAAAGLHLRTHPAQADAPVLLEDRHGPVALYGIPYLEPALAAPALGAAATHAGVLAAAAGRVRADLARRGRPRSVVAAHAFVVGGQASDSERDIAVGGVAAVPAAVLAGADLGGVDYVALGHLHGRQRVAEHVQYAGSPVPYSFSEAAHRKGTWLVELGPTGLAGVTAVDAPAGRRLATLEGRLDDLLTAVEHAHAEDAFCRVVLTDPERPREPMERLRRRFPHTVAVTFAPEGAARPGAGGYAERLTGRDDLGVCCSFLEHVRGRAADDAERAVLGDVLDAVRVAAAADGPVPAAGADGPVSAAGAARPDGDASPRARSGAA